MVKKKNKETQTSNITFVVWTVVIFILVFFASYFLFKGVGTYEYRGLTFTKEMFGQIPVYHYYYLYTDKTGQLTQNNIYLRTNPEKNKVPVVGEIVYTGNPVHISINATALERCSQSGIAISSLASFVANAGMTVKGAVLDNSSMNTNSTTMQIRCKDKPIDPVIEINEGQNTEIINSNYCYTIRFSRCEDVLPAVEKFIMQSIVDAKENN